MTDDNFATLERALQGLARIQVALDTVNQSRSNAIIVTQGLLAVAAESLFTHFTSVPAVVLILLGGFGVLLSVAWLLLEQRNQAYFTGRGVALIQLERQVVRAARTHGIQYPQIWSAVPIIVSQNAKWYQRHSAPRVFRTYLPTLFIIGWLLVTVAACATRSHAASHAVIVRIVT